MNRRQFVQGFAIGALAGACSGCKFIEYVKNTVTDELADANDKFIRPFISTTLMSWSVHAGIGVDGVCDLSRIATEIKRIGPDIAFLQDVDRKTRRARGGDQVEALAEATGMKAQFCRTSVRSGGETGLVILSADEPAKVRTVPLPGDGRMLIVDFPEYSAGNVHFGEYAEDRMASLKILRGAIEAMRPLFLGGSWRDGFSTPFIRTMRDSFSILSSLEPTFPADQPDDCVDYIAVSRRHRQRFEHVTRLACEASMASDHRPVAVRVR